MNQMRQGGISTDTFYRDWFAAWMRGMSQLTEAERAPVFRSCGKNCARPSILPLFQKMLKQAGNPDAFFALVDRDVEGVTVQTETPGIVYDFCYTRCLCPIYEECGVDDGLLCECSRESLQYVMRELFPERKPQVSLLASVLRGNPECRLRVTLSE